MACVKQDSPSPGRFVPTHRSMASFLNCATGFVPDPMASFFNFQIAGFVPELIQDVFVFELRLAGFGPPNCPAPWLRF